MRHALTVDVEDYFHVSALSKVISPDQWDNVDQARVVDSTRALLGLFEKKGYQATFFVLGWVADRYPELVKEIDNAGHEVASHGWSHQLVYKQTPEQFKLEAENSKKLLEDLTGKPVTGYRAASYSITEDSRWALEILIELGFDYDSSIFPVYHDRYGMRGVPFFPYRHTTDSGNTITEFPLSTYNLLGYRLPVAGGGYFRLFPYWMTRHFFKSIEKSNQPFVFYLHPWEVDVDQPRVAASMTSRFRHYNNLDKCYARLEKLLDDFEFTTMRDVLEHTKLVA